MRRLCRNNDEKRKVFELSRVRKFNYENLKISIVVIKRELICEHVIFSCKLLHKNKSINIYFMIDFDVNDIDFIDIFFARYYDFDFIFLKHSRSLTIVDDWSFIFDDVIHIVKVSFMICNHFEIIEFFVTKLNHYSIILELSWLKLHDLIFKWSNNFLTFFSLYCYTHCLRLFRFMIVIDVDNQFDVFFQFFKILNILKKDLKFNQIFRTNINVVKFTKTKNNKKIIISTIETKIFEKNLKTNVQIFKNISVKITISKKLYVFIVFKFITKTIVKAENLKKMNKKFFLFEN